MPSDSNNPQDNTPDTDTVVTTGGSSYLSDDNNSDDNNLGNSDTNSSDSIPHNADVTAFDSYKGIGDDTTTNISSESQSFISDESTNAKSGPSKKMIATILSVIILVGAVAAGVFLVGQNEEVRIKAWDCKYYVFEVSKNGNVTVKNGSTKDEPEQKASVKIDGITVATLDVPALKAGEAATLGSVPVPAENFSWEVFGSKDCEDSGTYGETPTPTTSNQAQCNEVVAYDENWDILSSSQLSQLDEGDTVRFTINGNATSGTFQKARFTINGTLRAEVTAQRPGSTDFYDEYTIPAGETSFNVSAEIFHSELGWL